MLRSNWKGRMMKLSSITSLSLSLVRVALCPCNCVSNHHRSHVFMRRHNSTSSLHYSVPIHCLSPLILGALPTNSSNLTRCSIFWKESSQSQRQLILLIPPSLFYSKTFSVSRTQHFQYYLSSITSEATAWSRKPKESGMRDKVSQIAFTLRH